MERTLHSRPKSNRLNLSLEDKVARMCVVGTSGYKIDAGVEQRFQRYPFGGLGIFTHNIESEAQLKSWLESVKELGSKSGSAEPYYISIDEEGGSLSNFKSFFPYLPGNRSLGLTGDAAMAYQQGKLIGSQLHELGIPMSWAPVLDVNTNIDNPVVGVRSFGEDPHKVSEMGAAYIKGMHEAGVAVTAKHFPGHGEVSGDSHYVLPSCELTLEQLMASPLVPFEEAIRSNADSIMVAHILFPNITASAGLPASLSPFFVTEQLRGRMGFEGVICTDDIEMGAIKNNYKPRAIGELAVQAGNDLILMCHTPAFQEEVIAGIVTAVKEGRITESRIDESLERIGRMHEKMRTYQRLATPFARADWSEKITEVARRTIIVQSDPSELLPLRKEESYLLVLPRLERLTLADNSHDSVIRLDELLAAKGIRTRTLHISNNPDPEEILQVAEAASDFDTVIQGTLNAHIYQGQAELAQVLSAQQSLIALILRNPYDADVLPEQVSKVLLCSASHYSLQAFVDLHTLKGGDV